jgi:2-amino-4-hydroxy-6-hydroxymethyldihydropteridine diphosphokinase
MFLWTQPPDYDERQMSSGKESETAASHSRQTRDVVIGLGSNQGDPLWELRGAVGRLAELGEVVRISALYRTSPVGGPPQPDYLNAAVRLRSTLSPLELLGALHAIERAAGRERRERWGPRTLDLDILWLDGVTLETSVLTVPHPRLRERAFALRPLLDVAADAVDPRDGVAFSALASSLGEAGVQRVAAEWVREDPIHVPPGVDSPGS